MVEKKTSTGLTADQEQSRVRVLKFFQGTVATFLIGLFIQLIEFFFNSEHFEHFADWVAKSDYALVLISVLSLVGGYFAQKDTTEKKIAELLHKTFG